MAVDMKQMIAEALVKLLETKSVDKITVKELVDACGISRQGFYYHFQDIMEVIEWITAQAIQRAVDVSLAAATPQEAVKAVILTLGKNRKLIQHLMTSQRRAEIERLLVESMRTYLSKVLRAKAAGLTSGPATWRPPSISIPMALWECWWKLWITRSIRIRRRTSSAGC